MDTNGSQKALFINIHQMENISKFLSGAEKLGVPKHDMFQTVDLYEKKNMTQVIKYRPLLCLYLI